MATSLRCLLVRPSWTWRVRLFEQPESWHGTSIVAGQCARSVEGVVSEDSVLHQGQSRGHLGTILLCYHEGLFLTRTRCSTYKSVSLRSKVSACWYSCSESACRPEASLCVSSTRLMVAQALVRPARRPGHPVLCRAVSQIVGDVTSVSVEEILGRHLEAVELGADVWAKACPLCRMRASLTCSELLPRTHLRHRRRELPRSMCFRIRTTSQTRG